MGIHEWICAGPKAKHNTKFKSGPDNPKRKGEFQMKNFILAASMLLVLLAAQAFALDAEIAANNSTNVTETNETLDNTTLVNATLENVTLENATDTQNATDAFANAKNRKPSRQ